MKKTIAALVGGLMLSVAAQASLITDLTGQEIRSINALLECPTELAEMTKINARLGSGHLFTDRPGYKYTFMFVTKSQPHINLGWIEVIKLRGQETQCKIDWVH
ncbi:MAG: hypothetical protein H6624_05075 [Bdellovibrionaceae bacterium]|nr:hypothetical protein [Bdellovibrionales bacterium]MCB9083691.1 hypothetical protein [Pseudobdellovibrionaceae bacterium]